MSGAATAPDIAAILGATGSGKTTYIKRVLLRPRPRRLLVWDFSPEDEYLEFGHALPLPEVIGELGASRGRAFGLVFKPSYDDRRRAAEFDIFCRAAYSFGDMAVLVEELRFVTQPSWSPRAWRLLVLTGRKRGIRLIGTSQRPAHIDKDFLGNATLLHTGRLNYPDDVKITAYELGAPPEDVARLQLLEWLQLDRKTGRLTRGKLSF